METTDDLSPSGSALVVLKGREVRPETHAIFLPEEPTATERTAAEELQYHLRLITGEDFEILPETQLGRRYGFFVGRCTTRSIPDKELDALGLEGLMIQSRGGDLLLAGNRRGVLYAVSVFLEDYLGCRWFTADCMTYAKTGTIPIPEISRRYVPPLEYRETDYPGHRAVPFAMRCRFNGTNTALEEKHGGKIEYHHFVHTFNSLVPPDQYFDEHPEYFSLVDGKRLRERTQLCLTNPDVLRISIERVREWLRERPDATIFSVSQNDWLNPCQCPECSALVEQEGSQAGPLLHFVNAIADDIKDDYPDKIIDTLAYQYARKPPLYVRPLPNVTVRLCSIECCFAHPIATDPFNNSFVEDLQGWSRICKRLSIWDYVISYDHCLAPFPNLHVIQPNIKLFIENGVTSVYEEANYFSRGGEMARLRTYLMAKTLWDPGCDHTKAINEFVAAYYGAAAPQVRQYVNLVHEGFRKGEGPHVEIWGSDPLDYMPSDFVARAQALFSKARRAVRDDPALLSRVRLAHLPVLYMVLRGAGVYSEQEDALVDEDVPEGADWLGEFRAVVEAEGITHYREGRRIEEFLEACRPVPVTLRPERIANGLVEVELLPGHGGRILRIRDLSEDVNWTKVYGGEGRIRPMGSGIEDYSERASRSPGWSEPFQVVELDQQSVTLRAALPNGLELARRVELPAGGTRLRVRSALRNPSEETRQGCLRINPAFTVPDMSAARLMAIRADGRWRADALPPPEAATGGGERKLEGDARPAGAWGLVDDTTGRALLCRVVEGEVEVYCCCCNWPDGRVALEMWSSERDLEPGTSIEIEYEIELLANPPEGVPEPADQEEEEDA